MPSSTTEDPSSASQKLSPGALVEVRGQKWVVSGVEPGDAFTMVTLQSIQEGRYGETLDVLWEVEPGRRLLPSGSLPDIAGISPDRPEQLAAFLDAVRWSAVTSADVRSLQAPFRSGVAIEDYQLEPVSRALGAPASTCCSPTTSAWARPLRPGWSPRSCCCATAPSGS